MLRQKQDMQLVAFTVNRLSALGFGGCTDECWQSAHRLLKGARPHEPHSPYGGNSVSIQRPTRLLIAACVGLFAACEIAPTDVDQKESSAVQFANVTATVHDSPF